MRWPNERTTPGVVPASTDETVVGMMPVAGRDDREYIQRRRHWAVGGTPPQTGRRNVCCCKVFGRPANQSISQRMFAPMLCVVFVEARDQDVARRALEEDDAEDTRTYIDISCTV